MPQQFVQIVNRGKYTNPAKAKLYCDRGLAEVNLVALSGQVLEIRMLEAAELSLVRTMIRQAINPIRGSFEWFVGDSGGSRLMKTLTARGTKAGVSGGYRVFKASRGE